jgi:protease-4
MTSRSKALLAVIVVAAVLALGVLAIVLGAHYATAHVPGQSVLTLDIAGVIPEVNPANPLGELFGSHAVSRQDLRDALVRAAGDTRVRAVRVKVSEFEAGFATVEEVRALLTAFGTTGKRSAAYLETAGEFAPGNGQYLLASACQRVVLNPLGDVNLTGLSARTPFIRGTLDKLGIAPEFPGIGDYKTARNFYTEKGYTPAEREMMTWLVDSLSSQMVAGIAASRGLEPARVRELVAKGPYIGPDARANKLVDELADWATFVEETGKTAGSRLEEVSLRRYLRAGRPDRSGTAIAVVVGEGSILRGQDGSSLFGGDVMGAESMARAWRQVRDSDAKAAIFRINSPGGSAVASEIIRAEMVRTGARIPVVVSMGDVAASGGYWITCGARKVIADPGTITASIGVFGGHLAMSRFWEEKLGVTWGRLDAAPNADIFGSLDPWRPEQKAIVQKFLDRIYDAFLERVSAARKLSREQVDAVGRGRVFTGEQAKVRGLVDELGGFDEALAAAKKLAGIAPSAAVKLEFYPKPRPFWQQMLERSEGEETRLRAAVKELLAGRVQAPGPVWLPPIEVR